MKTLTTFLKINGYLLNNLIEITIIFIIVVVHITKIMVTRFYYAIMAYVIYLHTCNHDCITTILINLKKFMLIFKKIDYTIKKTRIKNEIRNISLKLSAK